MSKTIHAASAFSVNLVRPKEGLVTVKVPQGVSIQEDDVADHWFTKAHLASGGLGSTAYAETVRAQADSAFVKARDAIKHYESLEAAAQEAEKAADVDPVKPAWERLAAAPAEDDDRAEADEGEEGDRGDAEDAGDEPDDPAQEAEKEPAAEPRRARKPRAKANP